MFICDSKRPPFVRLANMLESDVYGRAYLTADKSAVYLSYRCESDYDFPIWNGIVNENGDGRCDYYVALCCSCAPKCERVRELASILRERVAELVKE